MTAGAIPAAPPRPLTALTEGISAAAATARPLRTASIYLGLLTAAFAGPAVAVFLWIESIAASIPPDTGPGPGADAIADLELRSVTLILVAVLGVIAVMIEGAAIGIFLMAARVTGRPVSLRAAIERSRQVFWRLVRVGVLAGVVQGIAGYVWVTVTNPPAAGDVPDVSVDPFVGTLVTIPFLYANVGVVLADDSGRNAIRRSFWLVRRYKRLAVALGLFAILSGVVETLALGSGLDIVIRLFDALHLDPAAGGASLAATFLLALALVAAVGSLLFTVGAVVSAPQVVAWVGVGQPVNGVAAEAGGSLPVERVDTTAVTAPATAAELVAPTQEPAPPTSAPEPGIEPDAPVIDPAPVEAPFTPVAAPTEPEAAVAPPADVPPAAPVTYWGTVPERHAPFRWVTLQMRLVIVATWVIAFAVFATWRPG